MLWPTTVTKDSRGNTVKTPDESRAYAVRAQFLPDRSSKAEVPGQQQINVYRMLLDAQPPDIDLWSRVDWRNRLWDVVTPPAERRGAARATRHWTLSIRERPSAVRGGA